MRERSYSGQIRRSFAGSLSWIFSINLWKKNYICGNEFMLLPRRSFESSYGCIRGRMPQSCASSNIDDDRIAWRSEKHRSPSRKLAILAVIPLILPEYCNEQLPVIRFDSLQSPWFDKSDSKQYQQINNHPLDFKWPLRTLAGFLIEVNGR